jgi:hypothetical protein
MPTVGKCFSLDYFSRFHSISFHVLRKVVKNSSKFFISEFKCSNECFDEKYSWIVIIESVTDSVLRRTSDYRPIRTTLFYFFLSRNGKIWFVLLRKPLFDYDHRLLLQTAIPSLNFWIRHCIESIGSMKKTVDWFFWIIWFMKWLNLIKRQCIKMVQFESSNLHG